MSKKKGTTLSLAEFAGDAYENTLLPTESKGIERLDSTRPPRDSGRPSGDRWGGDRPSGDRWGGDRPPRAAARDDGEEGTSFRSSRREAGPRGEGAPETEASRADEISDWRSQPKRPVVSAESSFRSSRSREGISDLAGADDSRGNWRDGPRREPTPSSSGLTPTTSFSRSSDRKFETDATPDNWRDQLSRRAPAVAASDSSSSATTGGKWVPSYKRPLSASTSLPAVSEKPPAVASPAAPAASAAAAAVSWGEEEDEEKEEEEAVVDAAKLSGFVGRFETLLREEGKKFESFAKKAAENFSASELETTIPLKKAVEVVFDFVSTLKEEEEVLAVFKRCGVVFQQLQMATKDNAFELKMLVLTQKLAFGKNFPRISPKCALLEAVWLGLYEAQVVSEEAFRVWTEKAATLDYCLEKTRSSGHAGDFGRTTALFQTQALRQWLLTSAEEKAAGAASAEGGMDWGSDEEEEEEDVDAELQSYLSQTVSRSTAGVSIKKTISASAARR